MAELRTYEVPVSTCRICDEGTHPGDVPSESCGHDREENAVMRSVTAIDLRDVEPLVEAVREVVAARSPVGPNPDRPRGFYLPDNPDTRERLNELAAALEPFQHLPLQGER